MSSDTPRASRLAPPLPTSPHTPRQNALQASPSRQIAASNWQASIDLSLTTRRRLVRKALPQLPSSRIVQDTEDDMDKQDVADLVSLEAASKQAEAWWPSLLPERRAADTRSDPMQAQKGSGEGLDDQSLQHLLIILHYAALHPEPAGATTVTASGTYKAASSGKKPPALYTLDPIILDSMFAAVQEALKHLSQKQLLGSLQRTASMRWRAEAQLRSASATHAAESNQGTASRWTRFAWPAAALGKAYRDAQRNVLTTPSTDWNPSGTISSSYFQANQDLLASYAGYENRIRKRDVAVQILSNAVWFVRNYGPLAGVEDVHDLSEEELGAAAATSSSFSLFPGRQGGGVSQQSDTIGRASEALLKKNAGLPTFLSKSTPTTALSATATSTTGDAVASNANISRTSSSASVVSSSAQDTRSPSRSHSRSPRPAEPDTEQSASTTSAFPNTGEKSKAMEHLASLSAAAGAALRNKAALEAGADGAGIFDGTKRIQPKSSRQSLRSFVSQSEAENAETEALHKADPEYLALINRSCDEWAKMVLCRICTDIHVAKSDKNRKRRSGTITGKDLLPGSHGPQVDTVGSSFSTRSDMTAKAVRLDRDAHTSDDEMDNLEHEPVVWKSDRFTGDELFVHGTASSQQRRAGSSSKAEDDRIKVVGGTFVCQVQDEAQRQALLQLLELAVYVGSSMLLETSFLRDSNAARPKILKVPTRSTSTVDTPQRGASLFRRTSLNRSLSSQSLTDDDSDSRSVTTAQEPYQPQANPETSPKGAGRRWKKGLWGMLGQPDADTATGQSRSVASGTSTGSGNDMKQFAGSFSRTNTEDERVAKKGSAGLTRSRHSALSSKDELHQSPSSRRLPLAPSIASTSSASNPQPILPHTRERSDPSVPSVASKAPNRLVGRLFNAFAKPSQDIASHSNTSAEAKNSGPSTFQANNELNPAIATDSRPKLAAPMPKTVVKKAPVKPAAPSVFPLQSLAPKPFSTSPELSMLQCYQQHVDISDSVKAYLIAFPRLQIIRFLADQNADIVTFATTSYGVTPSVEKVPSAGLPTGYSGFGDAIARSRPASTTLTQSVIRPSAQLLKYDLKSSSGSAIGMRREEVAYYQRLSKSHDVPLGQFIEELGVRVNSLEAEGDSVPDAGKIARNATYGTAEQSLQYVHGSYRIKIIATVLPQSMYEQNKQAEDGANADSGQTSSTLGSPLATSGAASPVGPPAQSRDSDISVIAAAVRINKEAAYTASAVAETAVKAAERGVKPLVDGGQGESTSGIWMWNASSQSGWQARAMPMSESTYLMSFARFLEAITYHPALRRAGDLEPPTEALRGGLANIQQQLRDGRTGDARSIAEGAHLLRLFRSGRTLIKMQVQPVVTYKLCIEGPCLYGSDAKDEIVNLRRKTRKERWARSEARHLEQLLDDSRLEIQNFFASVKRETTRLESVFVSRELDEAGKTVRKRPSFFGSRFEDKSAPSGADAGSQISAVSVGSRISAEPMNLLASLKSSFRSDEFELYEALHHVQLLEGLNDMRKVFVDRAKSAKYRLHAWIKKHLTKKEQVQLGKCTFDEPAYLQAGRHAFPGSSYIIREDEPLSIVAFSLSSRDFQTEIGVPSHGREDMQSYFDSSKSVMQWRDGLEGRQGTLEALRSPEPGSAFSTATFKERHMRKVPASQLDPDTDEVFYDPEPVQATMKRKKRAQDSSLLSLTLRRVGSTISDSKSNLATPMTEFPPDLANRSEGGQTDGGTYKTSKSGAVHTSVETRNATNYRDTVGSRKPPDLRSQSSFSSIPDRKSSIQQYPTSTLSSAASNNTFQMQVVPVSGRTGTLASLFSSSKILDDASDTKAGPGTSKSSTASGAGHGVHGRGGVHTAARQSRESSRQMGAQQSGSESTSMSDTQSMMSPSMLPGMMPVESPHIKHNLVHSGTKISCVSWFAEDFAALRERWGVEHDFAQSLSRCQPWNTTGGKSKSAFFKTQDERFIAKQLLTVWSVDEKEAFLEFAPAYIRYMMNAVVNDCPTLLVKIAGVYSIKIKEIKTGEVKMRMNLMVLENLWAKDGGQSIRFDLKGIRDRKVKLTPQQQQDLQHAATDASAGAQTMTSVLGGPAAGATAQSSTIPLRNAESTKGENLAQTADQNKAMPPDGSKKTEERLSAVWWDSEWIERYRPRAFVPETQKELFFRAVQNDTHFLTASNVMDYSLLLGVTEKPVRTQDLYPTPADAEEDGMKPANHVADDYDSEEEAEESRKPTFRCRIVDFLGAFTLAKQLESSSKKALKAGVEAKGNVTILPPSEYASRFATAMDRYFIGIPCQPRLDAGYGFDQHCYEAAASHAAQDSIDSLGLPSVL